MTKPSSTTFSARFAARLFSGMAGALVIFLGGITAAPASAATVEWSTPANLSVSGANADVPQIGVGATGHAVVVHRLNDGANDLIQANRTVDGGASWSEPVTLSSAAMMSTGYPAVAVHTSGNVIAVWTVDNVVQAGRSADGGLGWVGVPVEISAPSSGTFTPQVSIASDGTAIALWNRTDGSSYTVQSSWSTDDGASWSEPMDVSVSGGDAYGQRIAFDSAGNAVAMWYRYNGSHFIVQSSRSVDGGVSWSVPVDVSVSGGDASEPRFAFDVSGNIVAVWYRNDGSNNIVQSSRSANGGVSWSAPVNLSESGQSADGAGVGIDADGNAVAVWKQSDGTDDLIQSSHSVDGGVSWSDPVNLSAGGEDAAEPQVAVDVAGNAVAVWWRPSGSGRIVESSRSDDAGMTWSPTAGLSESGRDAFGPQVGIDSSGDAIAVWYRSDGSNTIVQATRSSASNGDGGDDSGEGLANTGPGGSVNDTALVASLGLLALGVLTRVFARRRGVANLG
jgi:hypothetical protein